MALLGLKASAFRGWRLRARGVNSAPMIERRLRLPDRDLTYTVTHSRRRRTIGLKVTEDGLTVTLPHRLSARHADTAVRDKQAWVLDRLDRMDLRARPALQGVEGEKIGWLGTPLPLRVHRDDRVRTRVLRENDALHVHIDQALPPDMAASALRSALHRWRKTEALTLMTPKLEAYAEQLGARRPKVSVREQKRRWGSCSEDGSIRMNARLIGFDESLIDYVCAHEACHLKVMDHSKRFYALLDQIMPDHRARSRALKEAVAAGVAF